MALASAVPLVQLGDGISRATISGNDLCPFGLSQGVRWDRSIGIWTAITAWQAITFFQRCNVRASMPERAGASREQSTGLRDITSGSCGLPVGSYGLAVVKDRSQFFAVKLCCPPDGIGTCLRASAGGSPADNGRPGRRERPQRLGPQTVATS